MHNFCPGGLRGSMWTGRLTNMPRVIIQPVKYLEWNYRPWSRNKVLTSVDNRSKLILRRAIPTGGIFAFGISEGKRGVNEARWQQVSAGDVLLFSHETYVE